LDDGHCGLRIEDCGVKYAVITFGCRVNQADSLGFEEQLIARGGVATSPDAADLVIVNTCSVTATSDQGARQTIRRVGRDNPHARIVVTGCYATREPEAVAALPNVVRLVTNDDKPQLIPLILRQAHDERSPLGEGPCGAAIEPGVMGRTAYTLRVQTGCGEPCSYCIIPSTRGRPRSAPIADILRDIDRVTAAGFKEIALTGVHLGSYGRDLRPRSSLIDLLRAIHSRAEALRYDRRAADRSAALQGCLFRISSLEPMDCAPDIVDLVATSDRFAPHFHLPLQHASDRILTAMRRPYTIEQYASLVDGIRTRIPHVSIGSDVIVGFPGETDEDFEQLASYLERSPLTHVHVFPYSDRPGTDASRLPGKVHGSIVRDRARRIRDIAAGLTRRFHDAQVGTSHRALTLEDGSLVVTGNYLKVRIPPGRARNEWVRVRIASSDRGLTGEICSIGESGNWVIG
jgi:threonylcarbamoyladenosine tRNA methylthiotransferase MtaB